MVTRFRQKIFTRG